MEKKISQLRGKMKRMKLMIICICSSIITSIIVTKILATRYFKIVDGYVNEMCKKTKEFVNAFLYK